MSQVQILIDMAERVKNASDLTEFLKAVDAVSLRTAQLASHRITGRSASSVENAKDNIRAHFNRQWLHEASIRAINETPL